MIKNVLNVSIGTQLHQFDRKKRNEALALLKNKGIIIRQLERLTGIDSTLVEME